MLTSHVVATLKPRQERFTAMTNLSLSEHRVLHDMLKIAKLEADERYDGCAHHYYHKVGDKWRMTNKQGWINAYDQVGLRVLGFINGKNFYDVVVVYDEANIGGSTEVFKGTFER